VNGLFSRLKSPSSGAPRDLHAASGARALRLALRTQHPSLKYTEGELHFHRLIALAFTEAF
jgi:hypothetical protein